MEGFEGLLPDDEDYHCVTQDQTAISRHDYNVFEIIHGAWSPSCQSRPTGRNINHPLKSSSSNSFHFSPLPSFSMNSSGSGGNASIHPNPHLSYAPRAEGSEEITISIPSSSAFSFPHWSNRRPAPRWRCAGDTTIDARPENCVKREGNRADVTHRDVSLEPDQR